MESGPQCRHSRDFKKHFPFKKQKKHNNCIHFYFCVLDSYISPHSNVPKNCFVMPSILIITP